EFLRTRTRKYTSTQSQKAEKTIRKRRCIHSLPIGNLDLLARRIQGGDGIDGFGVETDYRGGCRVVFIKNAQAIDERPFEILDLTALFVFDLHIAWGVHNTANIRVAVDVQNPDAVQQGRPVFVRCKLRESLPRRGD